MKAFDSFTDDDTATYFNPSMGLKTAPRFEGGAQAQLGGLTATAEQDVSDNGARQTGDTGDTAARGLNGPSDPVNAAAIQGSMYAGGTAELFGPVANDTERQYPQAEAGDSKEGQGAEKQIALNRTQVLISGNQMHI